MGGTLRMSNFKIMSMSMVHQVGPKDYVSQNFSFLACEEEAEGMVFANSGNGA
jgi:hypothetical protein